MTAINEVFHHPDAILDLKISVYRIFLYVLDGGEIDKSCSRRSLDPMWNYGT